MLCLVALALASAPRSASMYYREAAAEYVAGRLPSAGLLCDEGLRHYPGDRPLQMLKERIKENQDKQKQKCDNPQSKDNQDQNSDGEKKDKGDSSGSSSGSSAGSSAGSSSASSSASGQGQGKGQSSSSGKNNPGSQGQPSSASGSSSAASAMPLRPGELTPEQAQQLLKDFNQNTGERKPWKPVQGKPRPEKDW